MHSPHTESTVAAAAAAVADRAVRQLSGRCTIDCGWRRGAIRMADDLMTDFFVATGVSSCPLGGRWLVSPSDTLSIHRAIFTTHVE